ncbi:hypothetical protein [Thaumasiovibrio sp. DFM-14]|uniref:hypothetical protein n=1 Tax=Thaumasiovibrio sp. DFM-14 TaxID=3384792 RepID=UPI0039A0EDF3
MRKKIKRLFPIDYYGEDGRWQFAVRAEVPEEVISAKAWQAEISCHREKYDLVRLATERFSYQYECRPEKSPTTMFIKMTGHVVTVSALNHHYGSLKLFK